MSPGVTFTRTDDPSPMHEVALNLFCTDFHDYIDTHGSAVLIGPGLALTARHNVEIFLANYEQARQRGEARDPISLVAVQAWMDPAATVVHRISKWFSAPWTDLAVLQLTPANSRTEEIPLNYRWRAVRLDLLPPVPGTDLAAFGFDLVDVVSNEDGHSVRARGVTATGVVRAVLDPIIGNALHGWPRFQTNARFDGRMSGGPVMINGLACGVVSTSLPASTDGEEHASFVPLLWPAMAIEVDDPRPREGAGTVSLLELVRDGVIGARGHELVGLSRDENGRIVGVHIDPTALQTR